MDPEPETTSRKEIETQLSNQPRFKYITKLVTDCTNEENLRKLYNCQLCRKLFLQQFDFAIHIQEVHEKEPITFRITRYDDCFDILYCGTDIQTE